MNYLKQIADKIILKDCVIITAVCFILTCIGMLLLNTMQLTFFRFSLLILLYVLLIITIFSSRVKYLSGLLGEQNDDYMHSIKLFGFAVAYFGVVGLITILEFLLFALFRGEWYIFYIFAGLTTIFFIIIFFSYIGISEIEFLKNEIGFRDFLKPKSFNDKYSIDMLAKFTWITLIQFVLGGLLVIGLIKFCTIPMEWLIATVGCYLINFIILKLEDLKVYYLGKKF